MQFIILVLVAVIVTQFIMILCMHNEYKSLMRDYQKLRFKIFYSGKRFEDTKKEINKAYKSGKTHARVYADTDSVISKDNSSIYPNVMKEG